MQRKTIEGKLSIWNTGTYTNPNGAGFTAYIEVSDGTLLRWYRCPTMFIKLIENSDAHGDLSKPVRISVSVTEDGKYPRDAKLLD